MRDKFSASTSNASSAMRFVANKNEIDIVNGMTSRQTYNCDLAYTIQMSNQPLINLFNQVYPNTTQGINQWIQIPSNQVLLAQQNGQEVLARWNVLQTAISNSLNQNCGAVCSTNLRNQLALHDLLMLSLLPTAYQPTTCAVGTAVANITTGQPVTVNTINTNTGMGTTITLPS